MWKEEKENGKVIYREHYKDFLTGKAKTVSVTFDKDSARNRKAAAFALQNKIIEKSTAPVTAADCTFEKIKELYLEDLKTTVKASTFRRNSGALNTCVKILGAETLAQSLNARYINTAFKKSRKENATINELMKRFKACIRWGFKNDLIENISFLDKIERLPDKTAKEKIEDKYLEKEDLHKLISGLKEPHWKLAAEFLALTGMRPGEAYALDMQDIDFENRVIHISKTYDLIGKTVTSPKTKTSNRDLYMQDDLLKLCKTIKKYMVGFGFATGQQNDYFFKYKNNERVNCTSFEKYLRENSIIILGRRITPYIFRHTHASLLAEGGASLGAIMNRLGHSNSKITQEIYIHITEKQKEKFNAEIENVKII